ncbi:MAG TPA: hypothetical protein V6D05_17475 [Stenomitos sp.]
MERDWIPPEPAGVEQAGTDEDLEERTVERPEFMGEFGEREEPRRDDEESPH